MRALLVSTFLACTTLTGAAQTSSATNSTAQVSQQRIGILLLAHGGSAQEWNEEVRHVADRTDLSIPTEVAFGMATKATMQTAIDRLAARKVTEIIAVPLFISSHSSVIDSTAYLLGLRTQMPEDLKMFATMDHGGMSHGSMDHMAHDPADAMKPVASSVPVRMSSALDHNTIVAEILKDRAASISKDPAREVVILVAHGPVPDNENKLWLDDMSFLAAQIKKETQYADIKYLTLRDDADDPVRNAASAELKKQVKQITDSGRTALIVPLLLSYGGIEGGLRQRLAGLDYRMPTQGLLPDARIVGWVEESAKGTAMQVPISH